MSVSTLEKVKSFPAQNEASLAAPRTTKTEHNVKRAVFTMSFVVFCFFVVLAVSHLSSQFQNQSYKAVVFFLGIIITSNITSKYVIWCMTH
jgi:hypothetical protein